LNSLWYISRLEIFVSAFCNFLSLHLCKFFIYCLVTTSFWNSNSYELNCYFQTVYMLWGKQWKRSIRGRRKERLTVSLCREILYIHVCFSTGTIYSSFAGFLHLTVALRSLEIYMFSCHIFCNNDFQYNVSLTLLTSFFTIFIQRKTSLKSPFCLAFTCLIILIHLCFKHNFVAMMYF